MRGEEAAVDITTDLKHGVVVPAETLSWGSRRWLSYGRLGIDRGAREVSSMKVVIISEPGRTRDNGRSGATAGKKREIERLLAEGGG